MRMLYALAACCLLFSCKDPKKVKLDWDANRFYADYVKIYDGYGVRPYDSTKLALQQFIAAYPNDAKAYCFYGKILMETDSLQSAKAAYSKALALDSSIPWSYSGLGAIANRERNYNLADGLLRKANSLGDTTMLLSLNMAIANLLLNKEMETKQLTDQIAAKDTLDEFFEEHLVVLYSEMNDKPDADKWSGKVSRDANGAMAQYREGKLTAEEFFAKKKHAYDGRK